MASTIRLDLINTWVRVGTDPQIITVILQEGARVSLHYGGTTAPSPNETNVFLIYDIGDSLSLTLSGADIWAKSVLGATVVVFEG